MTKRMYSKPRKKRVTVVNSAVTESASAQNADNLTGYPERWTFIRDKVRDALRAILTNPKYDWTREPSETTCERAESLVNVMIGFANNEQGEGDVKGAYTSYVQSYLRETHHENLTG